MTGITAKSPNELSIKGGGLPTLDGIPTDGGPDIKRVERRDSLLERKQTVAHFLDRWSGAGQPLTDEKIRSARATRMMDKQVK